MPMRVLLTPDAQADFIALRATMKIRVAAILQRLPDVSGVYEG
jgi:hypothetical protein